MSFEINEDAYLRHYGIVRRSGRYPWGSGETEEGRSRDFLSTVADLRKQGMSDTEIARAFSTEEYPFTTTMLRATTSIARNKKRAADIAMAERLRAKGMSNTAIAERMGMAGESSVRALLDPGAKIRTDRLSALSEELKREVADKEFVDVGIGVEHYTGNTRTQLDTALSMLKSEGYQVVNIQEDQLGTGNKTTYKVLCPPGKTAKEHYIDLVQNKDKIRLFGAHSEDGLEYVRPHPPEMFDSKRLGINYKEDGGANADGVMYIRPGAKGIDLGGSRYAQVRVAVDGTHYIKGMAVYKDDLPDGVDILFNTNKSDTGNKLDALKEMKTTPDGKLDIENPFGASIKPNGQRGVMNIVNEEGDWANWSKSLASQMLSKQKPTLAKEQLGKTYESKRKDLDEINSLTNPAVKRTLLKSYADGVDSASVHLKAAAMDRQATQVILPVSSLKDTEVYAPNFRNGERVALVRYPHGGTFEIPELTVNNNNPEAASLLGKMPKDAVGINPKVAERLSGADFDGDTVLVIPNNSGKVKSKPALKALEKFDAKVDYAPFDGMPTIDGGTWNAKTRKVDFPEGKKPQPARKQKEMGKVSNLITDMTIMGANDNEIAQAVKHSMVVIDAEKHHLNFKQSYLDNNIPALKEKYQGGKAKGAATLISRTTRETTVDYRKGSVKIDPETGEKIYNYTGEGWVNKKGEFVKRTTKSVEGAEVKDAHTLSSGTPIEKVYADHANRLKDLGNEARKEWVNTKSIPYSRSAKEVYSAEVTRLNAALRVALRNAPLERQAQLVANAIVKQKKEAEPDLQPDELKKIKSKALVEARRRTGAGKNLVDISDSEWEAIQAGAITNHKLEQILANSDLDRLRQLATPRQPTVMTDAKQARARQLLSAGRTPSEVADILGVKVSTLNSSVS